MVLRQWENEELDGWRKGEEEGERVEDHPWASWNTEKGVRKNGGNQIRKVKRERERMRVREEKRLSR